MTRTDVYRSRFTPRGRDLDPGVAFVVAMPTRHSEPAKLLKLPDPDIPVSHQIGVILEDERHPIRVRRVWRAGLVRGWAGELDVILDENSVVQDRHVRLTCRRAAGVEMRAMEDHVVRLPLAWRPTRVHQWRVLPVDRRRDSVRVGRVVVRVEHLNFID